MKGASEIPFLTPERIFMSKKVIAIIAGAAVAVIAIAVTIVAVLSKEDSYRLLKLFEFEGTGLVSREGKGEITPYANMVLESGDMVSLDTGLLTIQADDDKFIYLDPHTTIRLIATGTSENSKTSIDLIEGGITSDIRNKLSATSTYEINTPNSSMTVRGTYFHTIEYEIDGIKYTKIFCFNGAVASNIVYEDGSKSLDPVVVPEGTEIIIYDDGTRRDYLTKDPQPIDYSKLERSVLMKLKEISETTDVELSITDEELDRLLNGPYYIIFTYNGVEFGTQTVERGELVQAPFLNPSDKGGWDYDFTTPVENDTVIEWKE